MKELDTFPKRVLLLSYQILFSLSLILTGIALAGQCLAIYQSGDHPFTPEAVAAAFSEIAVPVYLCGFMTVLSFFLQPWFPCPKKKAEKNHGHILSRLQQTTNLAACPQELSHKAKALRHNRQLVNNLGLLLLFVGSIIFLSYGADPAHYHQTDINGSMLSAILWLLPTMAVPFGYGIFAVYYRKASIQKEIALLKTAPAEAKLPLPSASAKPDGLACLRWTLLAAAFLLILGGYFLGGAVDVLTKAVNICTECIGLG